MQAWLDEHIGDVLFKGEFIVQGESKVFKTFNNFYWFIANIDGIMGNVSWSSCIAEDKFFVLLMFSW